MKEQSIELLNKAVAEELSAIMQYLYFHFHCEDQGYNKLARLFRKTAIAEMGHLEKLSNRILFLKGDVVMKPKDEVKPINTIKEMVELARKMEKEGAVEYNLNAKKCTEYSDAISKQLFENLIEDEEKHFAHFDLELEHVLKFGDKYLALQSIENNEILETESKK